MNQESYNEAVSARAEEMIAGVARREVHSMWSLHTRLRLDQASDDVITEVVARGLGADLAGFSKPQTGGPFHVLPGDAPPESVGRQIATERDRHDPPVHDPRYA